MLINGEEGHSIQKASEEYPSFLVQLPGTPTPVVKDMSLINIAN